MIISDLYSAKDYCNVCGQTPCNCTHITESVNSIGDKIRALCQKIYDAGDDEFEYFYHDSPIFAQYWDEYEGDLDSIIAEANPQDLQVILDELESYVQTANLEEGEMSPMAKDARHADRIRSLKNLIAIAREQGRGVRVQELELELKKLQGVAETSDYFRRREREEAIISGQKSARKKQPAQTSDYARRRAQEKKTEQGVAEGAKWRDPKYKDKLYTQEPGDSDDYDNIGYGYDFPERPENDPGQKRRMGGVGSKFDNNDPLKKGQGIGRSGIKHSLNLAGKRKGLPSRDQINSLKGSIKDAHGKHHKPNLPEQGVAEGSRDQVDPNTVWEVCFDYGPHQSDKVKVKASSQEEAEQKGMRAAKKLGHRFPQLNWAMPVEQGVAAGPDNIDEAIKSKLSIGTKVHHPVHGPGTVHMVSQGGGSMVAKDSAIVKFGDKKKTVKVRDLKLKEEVESVAEAKYNASKDRFDPNTHTAVTKGGEDKIIRISALAKHKEQGWKERHSLKAHLANREKMWNKKQVTKSVKEEGQVNEVSPHDFDSDEDYYAAVRRSKRKPSYDDDYDDYDDEPQDDGDDESYYEKYVRTKNLESVEDKPEDTMSYKGLFKQPEPGQEKPQSDETHLHNWDEYWKLRNEKQPQKDVAENEKEQEADYGDDYQAMVGRLKKLAGMGPLKTVYDPKKRVYRNMPTAVQPRQQPKK